MHIYLAKQKLDSWQWQWQQIPYLVFFSFLPFPVSVMVSATEAINLLLLFLFLQQHSLLSMADDWIPVPADWPQQFHSILFINRSGDLQKTNLCSNTTLNGTTLLPFTTPSYPSTTSSAMFGRNEDPSSGSSPPPVSQLLLYTLPFRIIILFTTPSVPKDSCLRFFYIY